MAAGSLAALALAGLAALPVSLHVPGVLLGAGAFSVEPALAGVVDEVLLQPGADVAQGQLLMRLKETRSSSELALRERELESLRRATSRATRADGAALAEWTGAVERQRTALARRRELALEQRGQWARDLDQRREAVAEGLARPAAEQEARDGLSVADARVAALDEQLAALAVSLAERHHDYQHRERERTRELQRSLAAVEEARAAHALTEVRSPITGRVQSVLVQPGARVQPGVPLARVTPAGEAPAIVAFVPTHEAHRVFVGMDAHVAVDAARAAPSPARVTRLPGGSAGTLALAAASGASASEAFAPVELSLQGEPDSSFVAAGTRPGEPVRVHLHAGERRWQATLETWWHG